MFLIFIQYIVFTLQRGWGHGCVVVITLPTTSAKVQIPDPGEAGSCMPTDGQHFKVLNLEQLYVLVSSAHKSTCHEMAHTVLKVTGKSK